MEPAIRNDRAELDTDLQMESRSGSGADSWMPPTQLPPQAVDRSAATQKWVEQGALQQGGGKMRREKNKPGPYEPLAAAHTINESANVQLKKKVSKLVVNRQPAMQSQPVEAYPSTSKQQGHARRPARLKMVGKSCGKYQKKIQADWQHRSVRHDSQLRQKQAKDKTTNRFRNLESATLSNGPEIHSSSVCPVNVNEAMSEREREKKVDGRSQEREREKSDGQKKNRQTCVY